MHTAKFPVHRDLAGFDSKVSPVDRKLIDTLAEMTFTDAAHNAVMVGGPGTGKTYPAAAIGVAGITRHGRRVRFYSTVDLVNALEQEKSQGRAHRLLAQRLALGNCNIRQHALRGNGRLYGDKPWPLIPTWAAPQTDGRFQRRLRHQPESIPT